jgi:hypothetical protein
VLVVAAILLALKIAVILLVDELPWYIRKELAAKRAAQVQLSAAGGAARGASQPSGRRSGEGD